MFARHGILDSFMSDKMPFGSAVFQRFARDWGFWRIFSHHEQSPVSTIQRPEIRADCKDYDVENIVGRQRTTSCSARTPKHAIVWYIILTHVVTHEQASEKKLPTTSNLLNREVPKSVWTRLKMRQRKQNTTMIVGQSH